MKTKKKPAKKAPAKPKARKDRQIPLVLDSKQQDQLDVIHKLSNEKTATKAIIWAMVNAEHYKKEYEALNQRYESLEYELSSNKTSIRSFLEALKVLHEQDKVKPGTKKKPVLKECECCGDMVEHLDKNGDCPDCSSI